ncbi:CD48 antigen-like [Hemitrygon akajei]|uniref:CD48 antigen-like n=1 Tax=Hemitrygon akajei TaxID=2704970 RepID=UPI003BF9655C
MDFWWFLISIWLTLSISDPGTGASPTTVYGARGDSFTLHPGIPVGQDVAQVVWRLLSPRKKIVTYSNVNSEYYGSEEYKQRITFHPGDFSLKIRDLQREDTGDYEVTVTASSGTQTQREIRLQVVDRVSGTDIKVQYTAKTCNITLICSANFGSSISFRWWKGGEAVGSGSHYHLQQHGEEKQVKEVLYKCEAWNQISKETTEFWLGDICEKTKSDEICIMKVEVGHVAWITSDILKAANITEVVWRIVSGPTKIAECVNGKFTSFGTEKYKQRIDRHPEDCSLKIHDVQKEDTDVYEVIVTASSGIRTEMKVLLNVYDPDDGSSHIAWIIPVIIILSLPCCGILYIKRHDLRSRWDKRMGKKSGTSDGQVESQPLEDKKEPATNALE